MEYKKQLSKQDRVKPNIHYTFIAQPKYNSYCNKNYVWVPWKHLKKKKNTVTSTAENFAHNIKFVKIREQIKDQTIS